VVTVPTSPLSFEIGRPSLPDRMRAKLAAAEEQQIAHQKMSLVMDSVLSQPVAAHRWPVRIQKGTGAGFLRGGAADGTSSRKDAPC
jgi:hypothetical protein